MKELDVKSSEILLAEAYFKCPNCKTISMRNIKAVVNGEECEFCKRGINAETIIKEYNQGQEYPVNSLKDILRITEKVTTTYVCTKCGGRYSASLYTKFYEAKQCPYCMGESVLAGLNSLEDIYPELAREFDIFNKMKACQILSTFKSTLKWRCAKCGGIFSAKIKDMLESHDKCCPYCNDR